MLTQCLSRPFVDAIAMKRVAGIGSSSNFGGNDYIYFDAVAGQWVISPWNGVNHDIVGDFSTCGTVQSCLRGYY